MVCRQPSGGAVDNSYNGVLFSKFTGLKPKILLIKNSIAGFFSSKFCESFSGKISLKHFWTTLLGENIGRFKSLEKMFSYDCVFLGVSWLWLVTLHSYCPSCNLWSIYKQFLHMGWKGTSPIWNLLSFRLGSVIVMGYICLSKWFRR